MGDAERTWASIWCLLLGHKFVSHTTFRIESDTGRALYGELCPRCGKFQPRYDARKRFERAKLEQDELIDY